MTENERKPNSDGSGAGEGPGQPNSKIAFGKQLLAAYGTVSVALGAIGGAVPFVASIVKSDQGQVIYSSLCVVLLVFILAGGAKLAKKVKVKVTTSVGPLVALVAVAGLAGAAIGHAVQPKPGGPPLAGQPGAATGTSGATAPGTPATEDTTLTAPPTPISSATSVPVPASCAHPLTATSPAAGADVVGHEGVQIGITACGFQPGDTGWVFDIDSDGSMAWTTAVRWCSRTGRRPFWTSRSGPSAT